jgi:hypothetical protein
MLRLRVEGTVTGTCLEHGNYTASAMESFTELPILGPTYTPWICQLLYVPLLTTASSVRFKFQNNIFHIDISGSSLTKMNHRAINECKASLSSMFSSSLVSSLGRGDHV